MRQTSKSAIFWRHFGEEILSGNFCVLLYVGMTPQTAVGLHSVWFRDMSGTRRFWFGNVSADSTQFGVMSDLIRSWIGVRSADICPIHNRSNTDKPYTIGGRIKTNTSPERSPTKPTPHRHITDNLSGRYLSNMFERSLPDKFVCPNINRQNRIYTDCKPISPRIWWFLSVWGRFCVGLAGVTGGCLLWGFHLDLLISTRIDCIQGPFTYKDAVLPVWETHCGD